MHYRTLGRTGLKVSVIGFGASPLGGVFKPVALADGVRAVRTALDLGITFFDVAPYYGLTKAETVLGQALSGVPRDGYVLATKVGRYGQDEFDFSAARVTRSLDESLARLGTDHVDLLQLHDLEFGDPEQLISETLPALERLRAAGKCRFIGLTGLPLAAMEIIQARYRADTVLSYCHYTLSDTAFAAWIPALKHGGVGIINAAPLGMGLLTDDGPPSWHPAPDAVKVACRDAAAWCRTQGWDFAKLGMQFALNHSDIATTVVGMADAAIVQRNVAWSAEPPDVEAITAVRARLAPVADMTWSSGATSTTAEKARA